MMVLTSTCSICVYLNSNSVSIDRRMPSIQTLTRPKFSSEPQSAGKILAWSVICEPITWLVNFVNFSIVYVRIYAKKDKTLAARSCRNLKFIKSLCGIMESKKGEFWFVEAGLIYYYLFFL